MRKDISQQALATDHAGLGKLSEELGRGGHQLESAGGRNGSAGSIALGLEALAGNRLRGAGGAPCPPRGSPLRRVRGLDTGFARPGRDGGGSGHLRLLGAFGFTAAASRGASSRSPLRAGPRQVGEDAPALCGAVPPAVALVGPAHLGTSLLKVAASAIVQASRRVRGSDFSREMLQAHRQAVRYL